MKMQISALMDGELERGEAVTTIHALRGNRESCAEWDTYHRIGAALRGESEAAIDVLAQVMSALEAEPTILAPKPNRAIDQLRRVPGIRPVLTLAASCAGVALVTWVALTMEGAESDLGRPGAGNLAGASVRSTEPVTLAKNKTKITPRMQEYLVAHQAHAPGGAIVGGARNIRTVAAPGGSR